MPVLIDFLRQLAMGTALGLAALTGLAAVASSSIEPAGTRRPAAADEAVAEAKLRELRDRDTTLRQLNHAQFLHNLRNEVMRSYYHQQDMIRSR